MELMQADRLGQWASYIIIMKRTDVLQKKNSLDFFRPIKMGQVTTK
jgi:hypothetical protein